MKPLLAANVVAALLIAFLLIPGVLGEGSIDGSTATALAREMERNVRLADQVGRLQADADAAVCTAGGEQPGADREAAAGEAVPALPVIRRSDPKQSVVEAEGQSLPLVELLERSVVMVIAPSVQTAVDASAKAEEQVIGSGFLVDAKHVLTNQHVVGDAEEVIVVNKRLGRILKGRVTARTAAPARKGQLDLATIELAEAPGELTPLPIASTARKIQPVVSAGFPGFLLDVDADFRRLVEGDLSAAPEIIMSTGAVRRPGQAGAPVPFILHSADIAQGNSGGPLVNACGAVIGVNTLTQSEGEKSFRNGWAIAGEAVLAFLEASKVPAERSEDPCVPPRPGHDEAGAAPPAPAP